MRQVRIRTIGLIRPTSSSELGCHWFTSLWMIQPLVDSLKHRLVPLGLLSLIEMCFLPLKPRQSFWHLNRVLKIMCVSVCLCVCVCVCFAFECEPMLLYPWCQCPWPSLLDAGVSVSPCFHLCCILISDSSTQVYSLSFIMRLWTYSPHFLSVYCLYWVFFNKTWDITLEFTLWKYLAKL